MLPDYPLIGLTGHKGAGKDTVGSILERLFSYRRDSWANALKKETFDAFGKAILSELWWGLDDTHPAYDDQEKYATFEQWKAFIDAHKYDTPHSAYGWIRPMLQFWGAEYRRDLCGQDYWTKQLELTPGLVVTDCRFPNEAEAIERAGGLIWRVVRKGAYGDSHRSEVLIDRLPQDVTISNNGTFDDLETSVIVAMNMTQAIWRDKDAATN